MFCPKCGHEMIPNGRFCTHCGADVQSMIQVPKDGSPQTGNAPPVSQTQDPPMNHTQMQDRGGIGREKEAPSVQAEAEARGSNIVPAVADKNQVYYRTEFESIDAGKKPRFNWAAFLLGPGMCFYRKCGNLFKKYFLLSLVLYFIGLSVKTIGTVQFDFMLMTVGGVAVGVGGVLLLVNSARFGLQFNRLYHKHCKGLPPGKSSVSMKNMVIYYVVVAGLSLLISLAGTVMLRQQYAGIFDPDTSMDEPSETVTPGMQEGEPSNIEESDNTSSPVQEDDGSFKDFIGYWESDDGIVCVTVYYRDEIQQQVYAEAATPAGLFNAELTLTGTGEAHGAVVYGSEPAYTIDLKKNSDYLDADIYYPDHDFTYSVKLVPIAQESPTDSFNFVPVDPSEGAVEDVPRDSNGIPYSEYNLHFCEGSYADYNNSIIVSLTLLPNETEFSCELFWIHGKSLEQGTVSPGVPAQLSGGTTITLDLYQGTSAHVLLEGDGLLDGPYSMDLTKTT